MNGEILKCNDRPLFEKWREIVAFSKSWNRRFFTNSPKLKAKSIFHDRPDFVLGNILDNEELIRTLEETKQKATEISEKLKQSVRTANEIEQTCKLYFPVAKRGAILFFVLESLSKISNMYEYRCFSSLTF